MTFRNLGGRMMGLGQNRNARESKWSLGRTAVRRIVSGVLLSVTAAGAYAAESAENYEPVVNEAVQEFMSLFAAQSSPTIKDYQTFFGYSDFEELAFRWQDCAKRGMQTPLKNPECYREFVDAFVAKDKTPSQFFVWLKQQLPAGAAYQITAVVSTATGAKGEIAGRQIAVTVGDKHLGFWQPVDTSQYANFGKLLLTEVGGVPLLVLISQNAAPSILGSLGMRTLVQPLTSAERAQMKEEHNARCLKDPQCAETQHQRDVPVQSQPGRLGLKRMEPE